MDLQKVCVAGSDSGIGCGHRDLKRTINEIPFYHLYLSNKVSGLKNKRFMLKKANFNISPVIQVKCSISCIRNGKKRAWLGGGVKRMTYAQKKLVVIWPQDRN